MSLRSDDTLSADAILYARARIPAHAAAKAARATVHKAAGLETQKTKSKAQTHVDRKARKEEKAVKKAEKAEKAKAKPNYKSHEQKIKDKATVTFSAGVSKRLDSMGLHGKERKSAKKYHKSIMLSEMKKNGATKGNVVYVLRKIVLHIASYSLHRRLLQCYRSPRGDCQIREESHDGTVLPR